MSTRVRLLLWLIVASSDKAAISPWISNFLDGLVVQIVINRENIGFLYRELHIGNLATKL